MNKKVLVGMAALAALLAFAPAAQAQETGERAFSLYAGLIVPGVDDLDNDLTYGLEFDSRPWDSFGWGLSAGMMDLNQNNNEPFTDTFGNANGYFVDSFLIWYPAGSNFGIFGGLGFGSVDIDIVGTVTDLSDDSLTYNLGANYTWNFGENYLLRPQVKWRKWDGDRYSKVDEEYTLAFGWRF